MKHVLDRSRYFRTSAGLRRAYAFQQAQRPNLATLMLQRRRRGPKTGALAARQFLRIDRGKFV